LSRLLRVIDNMKCGIEPKKREAMISKHGVIAWTSKQVHNITS
jgi:hypothetical protein